MVALIMFFEEGKYINNCNPRTQMSIPFFVFFPIFFVSLSPQTVVQIWPYQSIEIFLKKNVIRMIKFPNLVRRAPLHDVKRDAIFLDSFKAVYSWHCLNRNYFGIYFWQKDCLIKYVLFLFSNFLKTSSLMLKL